MSAVHFRELKSKQTLQYKHVKADSTQRVVVYLRDGSPLVDGNKDLVEQRLKVVASDAVHHESFKRRH